MDKVLYYLLAYIIGSSSYAHFSFSGQITNVYGVRPTLACFNERAYRRPEGYPSHIKKPKKIAGQQTSSSQEVTASQVQEYYFDYQQLRNQTKIYLPNPLRSSKVAILGALNKHFLHVPSGRLRRNEPFEKARLHYLQALGHSEWTGHPNRLPAALEIQRQLPRKPALVEPWNNRLIAREDFDSTRNIKNKAAVRRYSDFVKKLPAAYTLLPYMPAYRQNLPDGLITNDKTQRVILPEALEARDPALQAAPASPTWKTNTFLIVHWWLAGLALVSTILLIYFYHRLSIKEKLLASIDNKLAESQQTQENLRQRLFVYAQNLADSNYEKKELLAKLERTSLARTRQEALESLSQFRISKTEDIRTFRLLFEKVFPGYWDRLKKELPDLTENEQMIASLFKLGYTTREMATVMGISYDGTKKARYRLKR